MKNLVNKINEIPEINQGFIKEYFERNKRKNEDEKWLKNNRNFVIKELKRLKKNKVDYGNIRVSMTIPDTSKFDKDKVLKYAEIKGLKPKIVKEELDEDKLMQLIEEKLIDIKELKNYAWVESTGSPRITLKEIKKND